MYFVVMPRVSLIVILVMYVRYLYYINCPTIICLPNMLLFILWRDATSELWTLVQFPLHCFTVLLYSFCLLSCITIILLPLDTLNPLFTANGEIDNLIVSWEQSTCLCCAGFTLLLGEDTLITSFLAPLFGVSRS
jgi:hypothetical protein